jgi:hypothetical protein
MENRRSARLIHLTAHNNDVSAKQHGVYCSPTAPHRGALALHPGPPTPEEAVGLVGSSPVAWLAELDARGKEEEEGGAEESRAAGVTGEDATARVSSSRRGWAGGGNSEGKPRRRPPAGTGRVSQWPRPPWGHTRGTAASPSPVSGERASGEGERTKRRIGKQKNLE